MAEPSKRTTRFRGERPPKRKSSSPPPESPRVKATPKVAPKVTPKTKLKTPAASPDPIEIDEELPHKIKDNKPLPVLLEPQDVTSGNLQSIQESAVLAISLERSRQRWLMDGLFEKYWMKPSKKKDLAGFQNPPKELMSKLGNCSMIIEPHVFEVTLYTVKEPHQMLPAHPPPPPAYAPPPLQYRYAPPYTNGPPSSTLPPLQPAPPAYQPPAIASATPIKEESKDSRPPLPPPAQAGPSPSPSGSVPPPPAPAQSSNTDPVIQMLAARAATDHDLKSLMKVVAQGNATADQLKVFQNHIDELNAIIKAQNTQNAQSRTPFSQPPPPVRKPTGQGPLPPGNPYAHPLPAGVVPQDPYANYPPPHNHMPQYAQPKPKPLPAASRAEISSIVFDFVVGSGDRYSLPQNCIIEYLPGGTQVLLSFLLVRKGSEAISGRYKDSKEYYQPVTMRLSATHPRILEPLGRVVRRQDDVRAYMTEVMDRATLANDVYLAVRLPKMGSEETVKEKEKKKTEKEDMVMDYYPPPDSLLPLYQPKDD